MTNATPQTPEALVDPWAMQRTLMAASGQTVPSAPVLHKGVMLYAALNLEEGQETIHGLFKAISRIVAAVPMAERNANLIALEGVAQLLGDAAANMKSTSLSVRAKIAAFPESFRAELTEDEIVEMTDGTTDLMVTNSGFALSLGLDGAACYNDVAGSNLSKRNDDGIIDKTPDGKWIKNPKNYREPNLRAVIWPEKYGATKAAEATAATVEARPSRRP